MITYRDMTFCPEKIFLRCACSGECHRVFDTVEKVRSEEWWGGEGAPVAFFVSEPKCFIERENE